MSKSTIIRAVLTDLKNSKSDGPLPRLALFGDDGFPIDPTKLQGVQQNSGLGLASGGFVRSYLSPIADLSAQNKAVRDPAIYCENGHYWLWGAIGPDTGSVSSMADIGLWTGSDPANLTYQGITIPRTIVPDADLGGPCGFVGPSGIVKTGRVYHAFIVAMTPSWTNYTGGKIAHLTADSPSGPWAYRGIAVGPQGTEITAHDNCTPVFYDGKWIMAHMSLDATKSAYTLRLVTAPSLDGPWTRIASPTINGGYNTRTVAPGIGELQSDSPMLIVDGGDLYLNIVTVAWMSAMYSFSRDLTALNYIGPTLLLNGQPNQAKPETGSSQIGSGNLFRIGDDILYPYMALEGPYPGTGKYQKAVLAKWSRGRIYVPTQSTVLALNVPIGSNASVTVDVPDTIVPFRGYAVDINLTAKETSSVPASSTKYLSASTAQVGDQNLQVFPQIVNQKISNRGIVQLLPGGNPRKLTISSNNGMAGTFDVILNGYWRLP